MGDTRREFLLGAAGLLAGDSSAAGPQSLWLGLGKFINDKTRPGFLQALTDPEMAKIDAVMILSPPATFATHAPFRQEVTALAAQARRPVIDCIFPVGTEGWEASNNANLARGQGGGALLRDRNLPREKCFDQLRAVRGGIWGLSFEGIARQPTVAEARDYLRAFGTAAHARRQQAVVWYAANWERFPRVGPIARAVIAGSVEAVDDVVWMDTKSLLEDAGAAGARRRIRECLGITGPKTAFQLGLWGREPAVYQQGRQFLELVREAGIARLSIWANPQQLNSPGWKQFYSEL